MVCDAMYFVAVIAVLKEHNASFSTPKIQVLGSSPKIQALVCVCVCVPKKM
jgi:hypothetical protein